MSAKVDLELARWLVATKRLPKDQAEGLLKKYRAAIKSEGGSPSKNWLSWLVKEGVFTMEEAKEIQKAFKDRKSEKKVAEAPTEVVEEEPEIPFEDDSEMEAPSFEDASNDDEAEVTEGAQEEDGEEETSEETISPSSQKKKCEECLGENEHDAKECSFCGASLKATSFVDCVFCGYKEPVKSKSCGNCGCHPVTGKATAKTQKCKTCKAPLKPTQSICLSCGTPVVKVSASWWGLAGRAMAFLQIFLVFGALCGFHLTLQESAQAVETKRVIEVKDPWAGLPPRGLPPGLENWTLDDENRAILEKALDLLEERKFSEAEEHLELEEDRIGIPGLELLGLTYFHQDKGPELLSLSKALGGNRPLMTMAALWRTWQARLTFREFEWAKAHRILEPVLRGPSPTPEQWFWGGVMAWGEGDTLTAGKRFKRSLEGGVAIREAHLFLFLLNSGEEKGKEHLSGWIEASDDQKAAEELLEEYR